VLAGIDALCTSRVARTPAPPSCTAIGAMPPAEWSPWRISTCVYRRPSGPGSWPSMLLAVLTSTFIDANQGAVQRWQEAKPMHETGVVSRVPCRSRLPRQTGRTATLTGQPAHTSITATTRRQQDTMNQNWKGTNGTAVCEKTAHRLRKGCKPIATELHF